MAVTHDPLTHFRLWFTDGHRTPDSHKYAADVSSSTVLHCNDRNYRWRLAFLKRQLCHPFWPRALCIGKSAINRNLLLTVSPEIRQRAVYNLVTHNIAIENSFSNNRVPAVPHRTNIMLCTAKKSPNSTTRTPATDMSYNTTNGHIHNNILQLVAQQICHIAMPEPNISTCQDVGMWQIFVRWRWFCRTVVSSSVSGVVQHVRSQQDVVQQIYPATDVLYNIYNLSELVRWWCPLVALYNMSISGARLVEFGTNSARYRDAIAINHNLYQRAYHWWLLTTGNLIRLFVSFYGFNIWKIIHRNV